TIIRRCRQILRCASSRSNPYWLKKGSSTPPRSMRWSIPMSTRSDRVTARAWWRGPGSIRRTKRAFWPMAAPRSRSWALAGAQGEDTLVVENTPRVHNLVVCTLCSCYPWPLLGLPPVWYKSAPYRSRAVIDPRGVLREFGVTLADDVEVRVWDSTAELRYLVLPERPSGSENMSEEALAALVTRDAMVGVAKATLPQKGAQL